ncbi:MAG: tRNA (adenosine(37)-N6)-dimethylallyltransferase MiaA [Candidatus Dependentiae bacterium]|jgi:tRNA dimethylallyltransferase
MTRDTGRAIVIAGPTASGKSDFSLQIAQQCNGEIINADSVQMYTPVSIGTAKPDWRNEPIPHHLFDIIDTPTRYDVVRYREEIARLSAEMAQRDVTPILVGGSLFYIKSLLYPPHNLPKTGSVPAPVRALSTALLYEHLKTIDADRAAQIMPTDTYRVQRAVQIWYEHGVKPSTQQPVYQPLLPLHIIFLCPPLETLYARINKRTDIMIHEQGWIDEARRVYKDPVWREFIAQRKFIGYPELFAWIAKGERESELPMVAEKIAQATRHYAKRQRCFWRSFLEQITRDGNGKLVTVEFA